MIKNLLSPTLSSCKKHRRRGRPHSKKAAFCLFFLFTHNCWDLPVARGGMTAAQGRDDGAARRGGMTVFTTTPQPLDVP